MIKQPLIDYYRYPQGLLDCHATEPLKASSGYLRFGPDVICYGQTSSYTRPTVNGHLFDASEHIRRYGHTGCLPFDPAQVIDNLRYERYIDQSGQQRWIERAWLKKIYYLLRPFFPVALRKYFQKVYLRGWETLPFPAWPVDR